MPEIEPVALADLTTLRVGAAPDRMVEAQTRDELIGALRDVWATGEPWLVVGGGSNLLIGDLIEMQFLGNAYNPHLGAGISLVLMVIILLIMTIMNQFNPDDQVLI